MSIFLTFALIGGTVSSEWYPITSYAESLENSSSGSSDSSSHTGGSGDSSGGSDNTGQSSGGGNSSGGNSSGGNQSSGDSGSSSGSSSSSGDSAGGDNGGQSSDHSGDSSGGSSTSSEETSTGIENSSEASGGSSESTTGAENVTEKTTDSEDEDAEEKEEKKDPPKKKKVEKDDSNGRDYQASEVVSSGNTSFTIVPVVRNEEELNRKINILKKRLKEQKKELKHYQNILKMNQEKINDIRNIYSMIAEAETDITHKDIYYIGCKIDGAFYVKEDRIEGEDQALRDLAEKYEDRQLLEWVDTYSTEYLPQTLQITTLEDTDTDTFSNVSPILKDMLIPCTTWISANQENLSRIPEQIEDTEEHIQKLEEAKKAGMMDLDSRLVEYKDKIPDPCVDFLNAVVAKEGTPYVWGASGPNSFDCSGLVSYGLRQCGAVSSGFRWTSYDFASQLRSIPFEEALPGDLVWKPGHIAIYIDENTVFEAPYTGAHIRFTACSVSSRFQRVLRWWNVEDNKKQEEAKKADQEEADKKSSDSKSDKKDSNKKSSDKKSDQKKSKSSDSKSSNHN